MLSRSQATTGSEESSLAEQRTGASRFAHRQNERQRRLALVAELAISFMNATLRLPEPADYEAIAAWVTDAQGCLWWAGPRVRFPFTAAELPSLLKLPGVRSQSYCLTKGSATPLGFGQYALVKPGTVHLGRIIIAPSARGQGFGRLLCQLLMAQAIQDTGATEISLRVFRANATALSLYSSLGFSAVEAESSEEVLFMRREANPQVGGSGR